MLIQFRFNNFKSFKNEVALDLSSTKITEFSERVISYAGERILPLAVIYGANASGKSNVYDALQYMASYVLHSFSYGDTDGNIEYIDRMPKPFMFSEDSRNADSTFEVFFTMEESRKEYVYNYGFSIGKDGVSEEWLNRKAKTSNKYRSIFYRSKSEIDLKGLPDKSGVIIKIALNKQTLIVSLGAKLKVKQCKEIYDWFRDIEFADFANIAASRVLFDTLPGGFVDDSSVRSNVVDYLSSFDSSIRDFVIEEVETEGQRSSRYKVDAVHKSADSEAYYNIPFREESAGTLKMFALYPQLAAVLSKGSLFFVDELNARLHPLLVRNIMLLFLNPEINTNHAQLVFTSHDTWQLSNNLLRRDEIWFTEKDENGISDLYSLSDFEDENGARIRKDESYEKNYLFGKYGAIPVLSEIKLNRRGKIDV